MPLAQGPDRDNWISLACHDNEVILIRRVYCTDRTHSSSGNINVGDGSGGGSGGGGGSCVGLFRDRCPTSEATEKLGKNGGSKIKRDRLHRKRL
ncbi:hypothetical protein M0802_005936 [Mischocyttarus mexicanus]|nr:hypothetical protein M0802_005936 [Mischocyttarus mexicanus]